MSTQSRLMRAARRLADQRGGLDRVTVDQIAADAGVAKATLYRDFPSKAALASQLGLDSDAPDPRTRILEATSRTMLTFGLAGTTVERVAAEAGISPASIYWHFGSKDELVVETVRHIVPLDLSAQLAQAADGPPAEVLPRMLRSMVEVLQSRTDVFPMLIFEAAQHPDLAQIVFERITGPIWSNVASYMQEQTRRGRFRPGDPMQRVFCLAGPLVAMFIARRTFGERLPLDPNKAVDEIVATFLQGVLAE